MNEGNSISNILRAFNSMKARGLAYFIICYLREQDEILYFIVNNKREKRDN